MKNCWICGGQAIEVDLCTSCHERTKIKTNNNWAAYRTGEAAFRLGLDLQDNPYTDNRRHWWSDGWKSAKFVEEHKITYEGAVGSPNNKEQKNESKG
jgi:hypothetical protein